MKLTMFHYFWTYELVRILVYTSIAAVFGVLIFYGITSGVVAHRSRKTGARKALTIAQLNDMSHKKEVAK